MSPIDDDVTTDTRLVWRTLKAAWVGFVSCCVLNTTFTVGPSPQAQGHQQMGAYDPAPGGFIFISRSHPLLAAAPTAQRLTPKNHLRHSKNENIQADGRVSADINPHTLLVDHNWCIRYTLIVLWLTKKCCQWRHLVENEQSIGVERRAAWDGSEERSLHPIIKNTSRCYMTTVTVLKSLRNRELHSETMPSNKPSKSL